MTPSRKVIDRALTLAEIRALVRRLMATSASPSAAMAIEAMHELGYWDRVGQPHYTTVLAWLRDRYPALVEAERQLDGLEQRGDIARMLAQVDDVDFSRANATLLSGKLFDVLQGLKDGELVKDADTMDAIQSLVKAVTTLSRDSQRERELRADLERAQLQIEELRRQRDALAAGLDEVASSGPTPERIAQIREKAGLG